MVTEPVAVSPIFIAAEVKIAPEPERLIVSEPEANALDEIVVGVAVKLAKVPPTVATATTEIAARLRRIFVSGRFLLMVRVSPFSPLTRSPSVRSAWTQASMRNEFGMNGASRETRTGAACALLGLAPAAEDQAAEGEAQAKGADREASDRQGLAPRRQALPAAERLALLLRQRLASALLSDRAAGSQAEIEVVEDLGGVFRHWTQSIASLGRAYTRSAPVRPALRRR